MFLKNFTNFLRAGNGNNGDYTVSNGGTTTLAILMNVPLGAQNSGSWIDIGTGDTAPTFNDVALAGPLSSGSVTRISEACAAGEAYTHTLWTLTNVYRNDTASPITIKELGWRGSGSFGGILLTRKVLDTPITINPGASFSFNITIALED